ncbi:MAG: crotonase/enoyl-CoA hydratase family protein [Actinomycetia bacterium]|nr:crotonase/enoyl-CoA hydratase family protein [Actinomycetes bacterium]
MSESPSTERVTVSITDGVADVRMNRPEKMNALDQAMFRGLVDTGEQLANDPSVRCVVLSGEGRAFCAGLDFGTFQGMTDGSRERDRAEEGVRDITAPLPEHITHLGQQAAYTWTEMPVPVIAAVSGVALGGGAQIALGADMRIMAPDARISILEIRWGLIPDMTGTRQLVRLVGLDRAKEMVFTGRMIEGDEAVQVGMATKVAADPRAAALELAAEIAGKNPYAIRASKRLLEAVGDLETADAFQNERNEISQLIGSPNQVESVMAFFEKRDPNFTDPA